MTVRKKKKEIDMLHGSLWDRIIIFALPLGASSILQQLFNSADVAVVGQFAGSSAMAAVGANSSMINLLVNMFIGLSIGTNVVLAVALGRGDKKEISEVVHTSITICLITSVCLGVFGIIFAPNILRLISTPESILDLAVLYFRIYFAGMPVIMLYNFASSILRSKGETGKPLIALMIAGVLNVILNLFFVIVLKMSVAGVGLATVISNAISSGILIYFLIKDDGPAKLRFKELHINGPILIKIAKIGLPAGVQGMFFSLSNVCIQTGVNSLGKDAIAGCTASQNMEYMVYFVNNAFAQACVTFVGQNLGANQKDRCFRAIRWCLVLDLLCTCTAGMLTYGFAPQIASLFNGDAAVIKLATIRLRCIMQYEGLAVIMEILTGALRGFGHSLAPAVATCITVCGVRILWVYTAFQSHRTLFHLMQCYWISWVLNATVIIIMYFLVKKTIQARRPLI